MKTSDQIPAVGEIIDTTPPPILASHQPDFIPYSGFFYKVAKAQVFDLAIYDQYTDSGYQRRVKMGDKWVGVSVDKSKYRLAPIWQVQYNPDSIQKVIDAIYAEYHKAPYYNKYAPHIISCLVNGTGSLFKLNINLIACICSLLGIQTRLQTAMPLTKPKGYGILQLMDIYQVDRYLSGAGAKEYIGDEFEKAGKELIWSKHDPITGNSVLEILFNYENPMEYILREHADE